jgi:hypothetical protein
MNGLVFAAAIILSPVEPAACETTILSGCSITHRAKLSSDDCTFPDGRRLDRYRVQLPVGHAVARHPVSVTR